MVPSIFTTLLTILLASQTILANSRPNYFGDAKEKQIKRERQLHFERMAQHFILNILNTADANAIISHLHEDIEFEVPGESVYFRNPGYTANALSKRFMERVETPEESTQNMGVRFKSVFQCTKVQSVRLGVPDSMNLDYTTPCEEHRCRVTLMDNLKMKHLNANLAWICTDPEETACKVRRIVLFPVHVSLPTFK